MSANEDVQIDQYCDEETESYTPYDQKPQVGHLGMIDQINSTHPLTSNQG